LPNASGNDPAITIAFCWSHLRREFYDLAKAETPIATETLSRIAALYQIEAGIRGESAERRLAVRQAESRPLVENRLPMPSATQ
jgi:transposase